MRCRYGWTMAARFLATRYRVQIDRVPFLARGNILDRLLTHDGFPKLDEHFQTNIPRRFITSLPATQDFGPFFGFTYGVGASAKLIGQAIAGWRKGTCVSEATRRKSRPKAS